MIVDLDKANIQSVRKYLGLREDIESYAKILERAEKEITVVKNNYNELALELGKMKVTLSNDNYFQTKE